LPRREDEMIGSENNSIIKYLDKVIFFFLLTGIVGGFFGLILASLMVESYSTSESTPTGGIVDIYGVVIFQNFFIYRNIAVLLLIMALILYPVWMWHGSNHPNTLVMNHKSISLIIGLLLPSFFMYGNPGGFFSGIAPTDFELTGVVTPIYNFIFSGFWAIDSRVTLSGLYPHQFALLGVYMLFLGIVQIKSLRFLEQGKIGIRLFLILITANLVFILLLSGNVLPSSFLPSNLVSYSYSLARYNIPTPMFTIGILIQGYAILKASS
jgi:hypothetical protein